MSEPVASAEFSLSNVVLKPASSPGLAVEEFRRIVNAVPGSEVEELEIVDEDLTQAFAQIESDMDPNTTLTDNSQQGSLNCTRGTLSCDPGSDSSIDWPWLLVILLVGVPICLILTWFVCKNTFFRKPPTNDQDYNPDLERPEEPSGETRPPEHVVQWLENPYRPRVPDPDIYFSEEIHAVQSHRKELLDRAKQYGYKPMEQTGALFMGPSSP